MKFLNPQIAQLAKAKKPSLLRRPVSCGIFQEIAPEEPSQDPQRENAAS